MKTKILLLWFISALCACTSTSDELPQGILSKQQMVDVITDGQMLDAAQKSVAVPSKERKALRDTNYMIVYNKHNTTVEQFDSSMRVYSLYPKIMSEILEEVTENINDRN